MKHYTSIEQSKKLLELGLKSKSADMCYPRELYWGEIKLPIVIADGFQVDWTKSLPCWSVGALLEVMPDHINSYTGRMKFGIDKCSNSYNVFYETKNSFIQFKGDIIEAVIKMVIYLLENKYIKTE